MIVTKYFENANAVQVPHCLETQWHSLEQIGKVELSFSRFKRTCHEEPRVVCGGSGASHCSTEKLGTILTPEGYFFLLENLTAVSAELLSKRLCQSFAREEQQTPWMQFPSLAGPSPCAGLGQSMGFARFLKWDF